MSIELIVSIAQLIVVVLGSVIAIWTLFANHERQKKQATIEFHQELSPITFEYRKTISELFGIEPINPFEKRYKENKELQELITQYLTIMERFAVGINTKVYDFDVFCRLVGDSTRVTYEKLKPVIDHLRRDQGRTTLYKDFEKLYFKLMKKSEHMNNEGKIKLT